MKRRKRDNSTFIQKESKEPAISRHSANNKKYYIWGTIALVFLTACFYLYSLTTELPPLTSLERIDPALASRVYSENGEVIKSFFKFNRSFTPYYKFPDHLVKTLLSTEDKRFFDHWGVDLFGVARAILIDIIHLEKKHGSSTLSMQLARNLYFGLQKTWDRKIKETMTALQIERTYSKREIIEMYLNINFYGSGAYGIESAARRFFSKKVEELTIAESALLIGVLNGQTYYNPIRHPERARFRRNVVLEMLHSSGYINRTQADSLKNLELELNTSKDENYSAPYFTEYVRRQLNELQDSLKVNVYEDGLKIYTTLNTEIQKYMEESVLANIDKMQERARNQRVFEKMKEEMGDTAFLDMTTLQIAFVCIDPSNGHILAMIGGRDFEKSKWNRATQMSRQPGSAFKPFLYTAAIDNGFNPSDEFLNQPVVVINPDGTRWTPSNYNEKVSGFMTLREAIRQSKNLVSIRLIQEITPRLVTSYAKRMGISTPLRPVPSLALGTSEVIPLELVSAYGVFSNNGVHVKPVSILRIEDKNGNVIYRDHPVRREVLSKETTYIMNDLLQGVVNQGTGYPIRRDYNFYQPAGGKTGTTNQFTDAWFVGFTPHLVAGVWVGFDDPKLTLGNGMAGGIAALPFWARFMKNVYDSISFPAAKFAEAPNVIRTRICKETKKLATSFCPEVVEELFNNKYVPTEKCDKHQGIERINTGRRRRF